MFSGVKPITPNNKVKFATYYRDAVTGDYADQRYYRVGRFFTPDPITASNARVIPTNWNKYAYVGGDPINKTDPAGLCSPDDDPPCYTTTGTAPYPEGGGGRTDEPPLLAEVGIGGDGSTAAEERDWWHTLPEWKRSLRNNLEKGLPKECDQALEKLDQIDSPHKTGSISSGGLMKALDNAVFKSGLNSNDKYMSLFPGKPVPSASLANMTIGQYFDKNRGTTALAALGGNTIYLRGSGELMSATIMHELLHNLGLEDTDIQTTLGIAGPSVGISRYLWEKCLQPPPQLLY
jgi:RHS repeat-associated protein